MIYTPQEDSYLLEEQVKKFAKGKKVLDVGAGTGIQTEAALNAGAKLVLAVDIDDKAVKHLHEKEIEAIKSNLFENVKEKFDLIIFNPPYLPEDSRENKQSALATTGGKKGDELILKFLKNVKKYLNKEGIILIVVSSLTPLLRINKILKEKNLKKEVVASERFFMEEIQVWKLQC